MVWLHGASAGESVSALTLASNLEARRAGGFHFVITCGTVGGFTVRAAHTPGGAAFRISGSRSRGGAYMRCSAATPNSKQAQTILRLLMKLRCFNSKSLVPLPPCRLVALLVPTRCSRKTEPTCKKAGWIRWIQSLRPLPRNSRKGLP